MSEFHINPSAIPVPPDVPTEIETPDGTAVPAANVLIFTAADLAQNFDNGITIKGGTAAGDPPGTGATNEVTYYLTNRLTGSASTTGAVTADIITFSPLVVNPSLTRGIYNLNFAVAGWDDADTLGASYDIEGSVILPSITTTGTPVRTMVGDTTVFSAELIDVVISGASIILRATGVADKTINWTAVMTYNFGGP